MPRLREEGLGILRSTLDKPRIPRQPTVPQESSLTLMKLAEQRSCDTFCWGGSGIRPMKEETVTHANNSCHTLSPQLGLRKPRKMQKTCWLTLQLGIL